MMKEKIPATPEVSKENATGKYIPIRKNPPDTIHRSDDALMHNRCKRK